MNVDKMVFLKNAYHNNPELIRTITNWSDISYLLSIMYIDMRMYACNVNMNNVVELGTRTGESTISLYSAVLESNLQLKQNCIMTSIDIDSRCHNVIDRLKLIGSTDFWKFICGNSINIPWNEPIDYLLIDTSHTYDQTLQELIYWSPYIKSGGTIWLHDIMSTIEVPKAIETWRSNNPQWVYYNIPTYAGLGWLKKP